MHTNCRLNFSGCNCDWGVGGGGEGMGSDIHFQVRKKLGPETDIMDQFLDPETDKKCQFLEAVQTMWIPKIGVYISAKIFPKSSRTKKVWLM